MDHDTYDRRVQLGASRRRREDAEVLHLGGRWAGAIYMGGYAIECALKALICFNSGKNNLKETMAFRQGLEASSLHNLVLLLGTLPSVQRAIQNDQTGTCKKAWNTITSLWQQDKLRYWNKTGNQQDSERFYARNQHLAPFLAGEVRRDLMITSANVSLASIKDEILNSLLKSDPNVQVQIKRTSLGWFNLHVVTDRFRGALPEQREELIDNILAGLSLSLGSYPFANYKLLTHDESYEQPLARYIQLPLWSEILMAPEPDEPARLEEESFSRPFVVTFYSFKGGVGRTTALGLVAGVLARKRRVVMIDLDLEAPGLSLVFSPKSMQPGKEQYGVLDYLYQRYLTPELNIPLIDDCIHQVELQTRGELYLVTAGIYDEGYIHRLADLDIRVFYRRENNPVRQLLEDIKAKLDPDAILIDARTGFDETSAVALFDLADLAVVCFSPTDQSYGGLRWVIEAARKQRNYQGKPDLRFLLTPLPPVAPSQHQLWVTSAEEWIEDCWDIPPGVTTKELYSLIHYNPQIPVLPSLVNDVPSDLLAPYLPITDVIDASLSPLESNVDIPSLETRRSILRELQFRAATAQEMEPEEIPLIFQRTGDFPLFLKDRYWLIRGAKGTGKSLLFRLFTENPVEARRLVSEDADVSDVIFIPGHGHAGLLGPILASASFKSYEELVGELEWQSFWLNYALLHLCHAHKELRSISTLDTELSSLAQYDNPLQTDIVDWLVKRARSSSAGPRAADELKTIDNHLRGQGQRIWLFYDELDAGFGTTPSDYERRKRALEALFAWWLENGRGLTSIAPKILLREDIWNKLDFTNKGHYVGQSLQLRWDEVDLWKLVLRQALLDSPSFKQFSNLTAEQLDTSEKDQLRRSLYPLWGERMGRGNKAYTYNWIRTRITDSQNNSFPRSLILLLKRATELERNYTTQNPYDAVLRPRALIEAMPHVSEQRVYEVRDEYPEFREYLTKLRGLRSPIEKDRLAEIWQRGNKELDDLIVEFTDAGIIQEYTRPPISEQPRYSVAELYLYGLGMIRKGQK